MYISNYKRTTVVWQGRAVNFHQLENEISCAQRKNISVLGFVRKVMGLGVPGLKYHVLGLKMVVSEQSNCP